MVSILSPSRFRSLEQSPRFVGCPKEGKSRVLFSILAGPFCAVALLQAECRSWNQHLTEHDVLFPEVFVGEFNVLVERARFLNQHFDNVSASTRLNSRLQKKINVDRIG
jgi:hypothetical protein